MSSTVIRLKQQRLKGDLAALTEEYEAVSRDIVNAIDPTIRVRLERRIKDIEAQIASKDAELKALNDLALPSSVDLPSAPPLLETPGVDAEPILRTDASSDTGSSSSSRSKIIENKRRRLVHLEENQATNGYNTPPEVLMEIDDLRKELGLLKRD